MKGGFIKSDKIQIKDKMLLQNLKIVENCEKINARANQII